MSISFSEIIEGVTCEIYMLPPSLRLCVYIVLPPIVLLPPPDNYCTVP